MVTFGYFWLTIQNTKTSQARSLFRVIAVFISFGPWCAAVAAISFPWCTVAESPARLALENPILGPKVPDRGSPSLARFSADQLRAVPFLGKKTF